MAGEKEAAMITGAKGKDPSMTWKLHTTQKMKEKERDTIKVNKGDVSETS